MHCSLFDIGKTYHTFPAGTFNARYSHPQSLNNIINSFIKSPPTWGWLIKLVQCWKNSSNPHHPYPSCQCSLPFDRFCKSLFSHPRLTSPTSLLDHVPSHLLHSTSITWSFTSKTVLPPSSLLHKPSIIISPSIVLITIFCHPSCFSSHCP